MPRRKDPTDTPRRSCAGSPPGKRPCFAREGSDWCTNHDPAGVERRRAAGAVRHPRFTRVVHVDGQLLPAENVPTVAKVINALLRIADAAERGDLDPRQAMAATAALKVAREALEAEREYDDRTRWAWEKGRQKPEGGEAPAVVESQPAAPAAPALPPWMQTAPPDGSA